MAKTLLKYDYTDKFADRSSVRWSNTLNTFGRIWGCLAKQTGKPDPIFVEIGTFRGLSTAVLARFGTVHTYDIKPRPECKKVWKDEGVADRIQQHRVYDRVQRSDLPDHFDAAFIDGEHTFDAVRHDFDVVRECGRVVFDDVSVQFPGVVLFVEQLKSLEPGAVLHQGRFAVWWRIDRV